MILGQVTRQTDRSRIRVTLNEVPAYSMHFDKAVDAALQPERKPRMGRLSKRNRAKYRRRAYLAGMAEVMARKEQIPPAHIQRAIREIAA